MSPDRGLVKPDLTIYIDANAEVLKGRSDYGQERFEEVKFQKKVSEAYSKFKELSRDDAHWVTVQADSKSIDDVWSEVLERVTSYISDEADKIDIKELEASLFKS